MVTFLRQLEYNMATAKSEHRKADEKFQEFMDLNQSKLKKKQMRKSSSFLTKTEIDDDFLEFNREQFIVGKQLSVFPIVTDGGLQD